MNTRSTAIFTTTDNMSHSLLSPFLSAKRWISLPQKYDTTAHTAIGIIPHVDTHRHSTTVPSRNTAFLKRTPDKAYTPIKTGRKKYRSGYYVCKTSSPQRRAHHLRIGVPVVLEDRAQHALGKLAHDLRALAVVVVAKEVFGPFAESGECRLAELQRREVHVAGLLRRMRPQSKS